MKPNSIPLLLIVALFSVSFAYADCIVEYGNIDVELSKGRACFGDSMSATIANFEGCQGETMGVYWSPSGESDWTELCTAEASSTVAICAFKVPELAGISSTNIDIGVAFEGDDVEVVESNFELNTRIDTGVCEDAYGSKVDCSYLCSEEISRKWNDVEPVALPMHFSYAYEGSTNSIFFNDLNRITSCDADYYDVYEAVRYKYNWQIEYDSVVSVFSKEEYVPVNVGENQSEIPNLFGDYAEQNNEFFEAMKNEFFNYCEGQGKLCYTGIPVCGDGVCDVDAGEKCWNCDIDCGATADEYFEGQCSEKGCTRCPVSENDESFSDGRGCVIEYVEEGGLTTCNYGMCDPDQNLVATFTSYDPDTGLISTIFPGRCCYKGEYWFTSGTDAAEGPHCEIYREVSIEDIEVEIKKPKKIEYGLIEDSPRDIQKSEYQASCCDTRDGSDVGFARIKVTLHNKGIMSEEVKLQTWLDKELEADSRGDIYGEKILKEDVTLGPNSRDTITFDTLWCVRTDLDKCESTVLCTTDNCERNSEGVAYPALHLNMFVKDEGPGRCEGTPDVNGHISCYMNRNSERDVIDEAGHTYVSDNIICDTFTGYCDSGRNEATVGILDVDGNAVCGGNWLVTQTGEKMNWVPVTLNSAEWDLDGGFWDAVTGLDDAVVNAIQGSGTVVVNCNRFEQYAACPPLEAYYLDSNEFCEEWDDYEE